MRLLLLLFPIMGFAEPPMQYMSKADIEKANEGKPGVVSYKSKSECQKKEGFRCYSIVRNGEVVDLETHRLVYGNLVKHKDLVDSKSARKSKRKLEVAKRKERKERLKTASSKVDSAESVGDIKVLLKDIIQEVLN